MYVQNETKIMPLTIAQKLRENHNNKQYREKLAKYKRFTAADKFEALELPKELTFETKIKLIESGFTLQDVELDGYAAIKVSW